MAQGRKEDTALGVARARFVEGLPRKASELKGAVALLAATPDNDRPREEMRRRLHALYASAQVFRIEPLANALRESIQRLDAARDQQRGLRQDDLDALATLAGTLPVLGGSGAAGESSAPPPPVRATAPVPPRLSPPPPPTAVPLAPGPTPAGPRHRARAASCLPPTLPNRGPRRLRRHPGGSEPRSRHGPLLADRQHHARDAAGERAAPGADRRRRTPQRAAGRDEARERHVH